ncbi:MAG: hypothetical protein PHV11_07780 [Candidatus Bipolaricaulis sp.]|nr:hypothetical protein [Candidatus Bipolaricaulis sp.]
MDTTTFIAVLVGALVAGLALFLLVGAPAEEPVPLVLPEATDASVAGTYWEPVSATKPASVTFVTPTASASPPVYSSYVPGYEPTGGCSTCSTSMVKPAGQPAVVLPAASPTLAGGCGSPIAPCGGRPSCGISPCPLPTSTCATPCPPASCWGGCRTDCQEHACGVRPQINRNMSLCVDECSFVQLHASVPHPICRGMRFEWAATKGFFLDATSSDPIYFAPTTYFPDGENVWVTLTLTDAQGIRYTDQVEIHVNDLR